MSKTELPQNTLILSERIRAFMERYELSRSQMREILRTPRGTFDHWLDDDKTPPGCLSVVMDLLEARSQVRVWLGVHKPTQRKPRGRPFKRGNPWRFGKEDVS